MCMMRISQELIAHKDIRCWKVFEVCDGLWATRNKSELVSCFQGIPAEFIFIEKDKYFKEGYGYCSYPNRKTARLLKSVLHGRMKIVKCFIPKGTFYYEGVDEGVSNLTDGLKTFQSEYLKEEV